MRTRLPRLPSLLALLAALLAPPALAQTRPAAAPPAIAPADARQALYLLQDDKGRAALIATLKAIAATPAPSTPAPSTPAPTTPAPAAPAPAAAKPGTPIASKLPLAPDSLVAQAFSQVGDGLAEIAGQFADSVRSVNDLPLLWRWIQAVAADRDARAAVLDATWKLLVVIAASLAAEQLVRILVRRLRTALSHGALAKPTPPPPPDLPQPDQAPGLETPEQAGERERSARANRLSGALSALRRLPFLIGRVLLDLGPLVVFAVLADLLVGTRLGEPAQTRAAILLVVECYAAARIVLLLTALLVSPAGQHLRLLHVSDWAADFLTRWVSRVTVMAATGYAVAGVGLQFGMYLTAYDVLLKLFALVVHVFLVIAVLEAREPVARRIRPRHTMHGPWAAVLGRLADVWHLIAIFYVVALWLVWAVELRNGYVRLVHFFLVTAGIMITARLVGVIVLGALEKARAIPALASSVPGFNERAELYYPILRTVVLAVIVAATGVALVEAWGFGLLGWLEQSGLGGRAASALLLIAATFVLAVIVWEAVNAVIERHLARLDEAAQLARAGRLRTLLPMLRTTLLVVISLVVVLMTLDAVGVNTAPLLAGAGVVGIAVGFGSQKLVQDLITGLFLLLENAMQVGDVVTLGGLTGTVEALSIRTIRLRAIDGAVHIIPFSAVTTVTNQTRDFGYAVLDVSVGLNEEPERVIGILRQAAEAMRQEPRWQGVVLEPLDVMGVDRFVDLAWVMKVRMKTQPSSRWSVMRELNRRFKATFDALGIESPITSNKALQSIPPPPPDQAPDQPAQPPAQPPAHQGAAA